MSTTPAITPPNGSAFSPLTIDVERDPLKLTRKGTNTVYKVLKIIGEGAFATVVEALTPRGVNHVAIKIHRPDQRFLEQSQREARRLKWAQRAPHVLQFIDDFELTHLYSTNEKGELCIVDGSADFCSHAIVTTLIPSPNAFEMFIKDRPSGRPTQLTTDEAMDILRQGLKAIHYLEYNKMAHWDLKPENIFYYQNALTIGDFGWSKRILEPRVAELGGTLMYNAPEQLLFMPCDTTIDVWGLMVTVFELFVGFPFISVHRQAEKDQTITDYLLILVKNLGPPPSLFVESVPAESRRFFKEEEGVYQVAGEPSKQAKNVLIYLDSIGRLYPDHPVWQARILYAGFLKRENENEVNQFIDFVAPVFGYEKRPTAKAMLKKMEPTEQKA